MSFAPDKGAARDQEAGVAGGLPYESRSRHPGLAIILALAAMGLLSALDGVGKLLVTQGLPAVNVVALRFGGVACLLLVAVALSGGRLSIRINDAQAHWVRGALFAVSSLLFIIATGRLALTTVTAITFLVPLFVTCLAVALLGERVGRRRWISVAIGFVGALVIVRPASPAFEVWTLIPVVSSFCMALGLVITRSMRAREDPFATLTMSALVGAVVLMPLCLIERATPTAGQIAWLAVSVLCHIAGHYLLIRAYMLATASMLAPVSYTSLLWATLIGSVVFGSLPDQATILGASLLIGAGLIVWQGNFARPARATNPSVTPRLLWPRLPPKTVQIRWTRVERSKQEAVAQS